MLNSATHAIKIYFVLFLQKTIDICKTYRSSQKSTVRPIVIEMENELMLIYKKPLH